MERSPVRPGHGARAPSRRLPGFWLRRSLRFWLAAGMLTAIGPLALSAGLGYLLYRDHVVYPLVEDTTRQRALLQPLHLLQNDLWDLSESINDFVVDGQQRHVEAYRAEVEAIGARLQALSAGVDGTAETALLDRAYADWLPVQEQAMLILESGGAVAPEALRQPAEAFEGDLAALARDIEGFHGLMRAQTDAALEEALSNLALSEDIALGAFFLSLCLVLLGVTIINHSLVSSMNQLTDAALRLAAGDRNQHIEIQIPAELVNVANAFNVMNHQIQEQEEALAQLAQTDGLTGLNNRREFDRMLAEEVRRGDRYHADVSLVMIDLDHFKAFNDSHGHQGGDEALRAVARALRSSIRTSDKAFRFGGEEFAVILPASDAAAALQLAERIREAIAAEPVDLGSPGRVAVTASLGIATLSEAAATPEALLKAADAALYRSKENGRNRVTAA